MSLFCEARLPVPFFPKERLQTTANEQYKETVAEYTSTPRREYEVVPTERWCWQVYGTAYQRRKGPVLPGTALSPAWQQPPPSVKAMRRP